MTAKGFFCFLAGFMACLADVTCAQTIIVSGTISSNTVWSADTVIVIGDVEVAPGVLLTISPGTYIEIQGYYQITVAGRLKCMGQPGDSIVFTSHDTTGFWQDSTSVSGGWGGIRLQANDTSSDVSVFTYCVIGFGKKADQYGGDVMGGALCAKDYGGVIIQHCRLHDNVVICDISGLYGARGGAVFCENVNYILIDSNLFVRNRSFDWGGALYLTEPCSHMVVSHNLFLDNSAIFFHYNPGFYVIGGSAAAVMVSTDPGITPEVHSNHCYGNKSLNGSIYISSWYGHVYNNVVCNNYGNGITDGHQLSTSRIFNNTVVNNESFRGGIWVFSSARIYNNICWGNIDRMYGQCDQIQTDHMFGQDPELFSNCVSYGDAGTSGIDEYPEFAEPTSGVGTGFNGYVADWTLLETSSSINAGTQDTAGLQIPPSDMTGNPRIFGNRIDIGAYENQSVWTGLGESTQVLASSVIYPNPGRDQVTICCPSADAFFRMTDMHGRSLVETNIGGGLVLLSTVNIPKGVYLYSICNQEGRIIAKGKWVRE